jgi:hypothetical protein
MRRAAPRRAAPRRAAPRRAPLRSFPRVPPSDHSHVSPPQIIPMCPELKGIILLTDRWARRHARRPAAPRRAPGAKPTPPPGFAPQRMPKTHQRPRTKAAAAPTPPRSTARPAAPAGSTCRAAPQAWAPACCATSSCWTPRWTAWPASSGLSWTRTWPAACATPQVGRRGRGGVEGGLPRLAAGRRVRKGLQPDCALACDLCSASGACKWANVLSAWSCASRRAGRRAAC